MSPDDFKQAWQTQTSQTRLTIDPQLVLNEVRRNQRQFTAVLFWRDIREMGVAMLMIPIWLYMGVRLALPWTWHLTIPALMWIAGYMLVDLLRQRRQMPEAGEPLRQRVESSLAQVEHQIWLLRNVFWWYLLPLALSILAFLVQVTWQVRAGGWLTLVCFTGMLAAAAILMAAVYALNQTAVRTELEPRRAELEALLLSLKDEPPAVGA